MALSRALAAQLKKYNSLLYPAKMGYRNDTEKYYFDYSKNGKRTKRSLGRDIHLSFKYAKDLKDECIGMTNADSSSLNLLDWYERWSAKKYPELSPKSVSNYRYCWANVDDSVKMMLLSKLAQKEIEEELNKIGSESKRKHIAVFLSVLLSAAVKDGLLHKSPYKASYKRKKRFVPILDYDELLMVCNSASESAKAAIALAGFCGLRRGEVLGLRVKDIDLEKHWVYILQSRVSIDGETGGIFKGTKTNEPRLIPMPDEVVPYVQNHIEINRLKGDDLLYSKLRTDLSRRLQTACQKAGVERVTFHDLRHIFGTNAVMHGGIAFAQAALGHKDVKMTLDTYGHLTPFYLQNQMQNINSNMIYAKARDLAEKILSESENIQNQDKLNVLSRELAEITLQICPDLSRDNKKGLTRKPVSP